MSDHLNDHLSRALEAMTAADIDMVLLGREANARWVSGANRLWLAGTRPFAPGCVVVRETQSVHLLSVTDDGIPTSIGHECLYPITWNPMKLLGAVSGIPGAQTARRVGVDGMSPLFEQLLAGAFPDAEIVDAEVLWRGLRRVKSPTDVDAIRSAIEVAEGAFSTVTAAVAPGIREVELKGAFEEAMAGRGVTTPAFEGTFCIVDPGLPPRALVTNRALADGDVIHVRAGVLRDAWEGSLARTLPCGGSLDVTIARAALDDVTDACRADTAVGALRERAGVCVDGVGMGHEELGATDVLKAGTVLSIEVLVDDVLLGDMVLVTDGDPERLTTFADT
jgi:Xaa-Pro dipeptidase